MALQANSLAVLTLTIGCVTMGYLVDRLGVGQVLFVGCLLLALGCFSFYHQLAADPASLYWRYALLGFSVGIVGIVPYVMVNAFPATVRFSGLSFSYNLAYAIFGGLTPMCVTLWVQQDVLAPSHYVMSLALLGAAIGIWLCWKPLSSLGREL